MVSNVFVFTLVSPNKSTGTTSQLNMYDYINKMMVMIKCLEGKCVLLLGITDHEELGFELGGVEGQVGERPQDQCK